MCFNWFGLCSKQTNKEKSDAPDKQEIDQYPIKYLVSEGFTLENAEKALNNAIQNRKLEIELYWKRAAHFWVFIGLVWAAWGLTLKEMDVFSVTPACLSHLQISFLVAISSVGLFLSYAWILVNKGSKFWQENWEHQIHYLEDSVIGKSYKLILSELDKEKENDSSVNTKLNSTKSGCSNKTNKIETEHDTHIVKQTCYSVTQINMLIAKYNFVLWCLIFGGFLMLYFLCSLCRPWTGMFSWLLSYVTVVICLIVLFVSMIRCSACKSRFNGQLVSKSTREVFDPIH